jgi:choline-sulfatase
MNRHLSRRDFLKLAGLAPLSIAAPSVMHSLGIPQALQHSQKNVIIVVCDALSAYNISLYGYGRETMPNLSRLARRATVYHNHFAGGNFTTPGTASLLTGTLPWTHRAFVFNGKVTQKHVDRNIFQTFSDYYRLTYTHNSLVATLLKQFYGSLDNLIPIEKLLLTYDGFIPTLFPGDDDIANVSWVRAIKNKDEGYSYSLFLSNFYKLFSENKVAGLRPSFPIDLPNISGDNYYLLEQAVDWIGDLLGTVRQPFLGYFHFLPPHYPYNTHREFFGRFDKDGFEPVEKPLDPFSQNQGRKNLPKKRKEYDEFILYADREFGRFYDHLEAAGLLENSILVFTSDHGELFERSIIGHRTPVLYQPIIRVPLLIFEPGQETRRDIFTPTSAVDVMPTLLHLTDHKIPAWVEGTVLPPYAPAKPGQPVYALQAWNNEPDAPLEHATAMLVKGRYKLIYYFGYAPSGTDQRIQLFDLENDPEELTDLASLETTTTQQLWDELKVKLADANQAYQ